MKRPPTEGWAQRGSFLRACTKAVRLAIHLPRMQPTSAACVRGVIMQPRHICCHADAPGVFSFPLLQPCCCCCCPCV